MNVLIVCSGNAPGFIFEKHQAFIHDQAEAVQRQDRGIHFDYFFINQKGVMGYLNCLKKLNEQLSQNSYDCVHAHFATSALLANFQRNIPVVSTFHGSDINLKMHRLLSLSVEILSKRTIYVSHILRTKAIFSFDSKSQVIPCGVDFALFVPRAKEAVRKMMGLSLQKKYILFSSSFENKVKNYPLAKAALHRLKDMDVEMIELKDYSREEVARLMTAVDVALMTSYTEGSPQFVKEALACNCPVVSTNVGDVSSVIGSVEGCHLTTYEAEDVAHKLTLVFQSSIEIRGRESIRHFNNQLIAKKLIDVYKSI